MILYSQSGQSNPYVVQEPVAGERADRDTLYAMGTRLLTLVQNVLVGRGLSVPGRSVVYMAPIPADCEQVAVLYSGWNPTPGVEGPMTCESFRWMGEFSVIITRCTPALPGNTVKTATPSVEKMNKAADMASQDAEAMLEVLQHLGEFANPSVVVQSPMGGLQTVEFNVSIPAGAI